MTVFKLVYWKYKFSYFNSKSLVDFRQIIINNFIISKKQFWLKGVGLILQRLTWLHTAFVFALCTVLNIEIFGEKG